MRSRTLPAALLIVTLLGSGCAPGQPLPAGSPAPAAPVTQQASIQVEGETYALPAGVAAPDVVWAPAADRIAWAVARPGAPSVIRVTPRQPGGGALIEGAADLVPVPGAPDGGPARLLRMDVTGDWLVYVTETQDRETGRRIGFQLYAINLLRPAGSNGIGSVRAGPAARLVTAVGNGYAAWQWASPQPPDDRFTLGGTRVFRLGGTQDWELPGVGWASSLHLEPDALVADLRDGGTERHPLWAPGAHGAEVLVARADLDGDGQPDDVLGQSTQTPGLYTAVSVRPAAGRSLPLPGPAAGAPVVEPNVSVEVVRMGAPAPVLLVTRGVGTMGQYIQAFIYSRDRGALVPLTWSGREGIIGYPGTDPATRSVIVGGRTMDYVRHMHYTAYTYRDGALAVAGEWYGPRPEELSYPAEPTFVLLATFTAMSLGLVEETPRYFADPHLGEMLQREWTARIPRDATWHVPAGPGVANPYPGDGVPVPFTAWGGAQAPDSPAVWLQGKVAFVRQGRRYLIQQLDLTETPLRVSTLKAGREQVLALPEVAAYLRAAQDAGRTVVDLAPAFSDGKWNVGIPAAGDSRALWRVYQVDARTGEVQQSDH